MKKLSFILSIILLVGILAACGDKNESSNDKEKESESNALSEEKLVIGTTAGPQEQIMEKVVEVAAEEGLEIELKVFSDYILPNTALAEGDLDANSYQHKPFLDQFNEDHDTDLSVVGKTILNPMGVYSEEYDNFDDLPDGAKIGLPNDPTNGSRALYILEKAGYITLKEGKDENASIMDIEDNPKNLDFIELEAAQIPKQLSELDAAAINTNFAIEAGLVPTEDAIILESTDSPYVNYLVVRTENIEDPVVEKLVKAYQNDEVKAFIEEEFKGSMIPSWD
ncbi:MetQ/NlpA family ABC transporter substrate-binding protein [Pseudogracilibacillus auburnensis]|uniref:Lipoprotein n=1 Tax=Pseudogracilibacillus auburnensis TaxID=1494959 RepID=A0A2V3W7Y7_9BACI|nr:MetQ/NlpA family ABC transporter substrate-binding protein [Pseudogracilibacillus auburnensis]MBO1001925.1 MetQ/NlpA family ABC transporter substrate-binding protein [Pseudogracilibacillus auburnensis]PXW90140.1 D-methionine transport system substrate-binding protein [Pseudogracilibacillus auburnensis]